MNSSINIPKKFNLLGHTYKVKFVKKVDSRDSPGDIDPNTKIIRLKKSSKSHSKDLVEETFFHEMIHGILDELEYGNLSNDEQLVERVGRALHQVFKSSEY